MCRPIDIDSCATTSKRFSNVPNRFQKFPKLFKEVPYDSVPAEGLEGRTVGVFDAEGLLV